MKKSLSAMFLCGVMQIWGPVFSQQCSNSGAKNGTIFTNDNSIAGYPFSTPSNASLSDGIVSAASATLTLLSGNTQYLETTGFGFSIPNSASICGIKVEIEKSATGINLLANVKDNSVRLVKGGVPTGSNYAKSGNWSPSSNYFTYGGTNDLWGTTWTRNDINSANFGIALSAKINGLLSLLPSAQIDHVLITVYFNIILPIGITDFSAAAGVDNSANLEWTFSGEETNGTLNVQRKTANMEWKTIKTFKTGGMNGERRFTFTDTGCHEQYAYYRIEYVTAAGANTYSNIANVSWPTGKIFIYPNPASNEININHPLNTSTVYCNGTDGSRWKLPVLNRGARESKLEIRQLPPGTYVLNMDGNRAIFIKK